MGDIMISNFEKEQEIKNPIVELDVSNPEEVPEGLYEYLIDQFVEKARTMGYYLIEDDIILDNWKITCEIVSGK